MASTYFTVPRFAKAKKNKEDLEKTNPKEPVLKDDDEKFLHTQISSDQAEKQTQDVPAAKITDDGLEKEASKEEQERAGGSVVVPETKPETGDGTNESQTQQENAVPETTSGSGDGTNDAPVPQDQATYDDLMKEKAAERVKLRKEKKKKSNEFPTQEEAEAATRAFNAQQEQGTSPTEKRTWATYLSSVTPTLKRDGDGQTWSQYASAYVPSMPNMPNVTLPTLKRKDKDSQPNIVYNEDGTINEEATKEQQEREVSVLLDNLNLSSINNRVFAFSAETQKIYERFAQCLKDIINGAPTAYEDMDKLMREAGPKIEAQFQSMPPFVQTLVKALPMRIGSTLGPELMAAASEKPGADMKSRLAAASQPGAADSGINLASTSTSTSTVEKKQDGTQKQKRRIPGLKSLVGEKSAVATMLRSCVNFLQTRFPFLAGTANVALSLAVFSKSLPFLATRTDVVFVLLVGD